MPALLTRMSSPPSCVDRLGDRGTHRGVVGDVGRDGDMRPPATGEMSRSSTATSGAAVGKGVGDGQPDPGGAAGDEGREPVELCRSSGRPERLSLAAEPVDLELDDVAGLR